MKSIHVVPEPRRSERERDREKRVRIIIVGGGGVGQNWSVLCGRVEKSRVEHFGYGGIHRCCSGLIDYWESELGNGSSSSVPCFTLHGGGPRRGNYMVVESPHTSGGHLEFQLHPQGPCSKWLELSKMPCASKVGFGRGCKHSLFLFRSAGGTFRLRIDEDDVFWFLGVGLM